MLNPIQHLYRDEHGTVRFQENKIVSYLLENGPFTMNDIARLQFSQNDQEQFAQLIGYSLSGFNELSYVSDETAACAGAMAEAQGLPDSGCRSHGCPVHCGVALEEQQ